MNLSSSFFRPLSYGFTLYGQLEPDFIEEETKKIGNEEGIVFLIDLSQYLLTIHSSEQLYQIITPDKANDIMDQTYLKVVEGDFLGCAKDCYTMIYEELQK